MNGKRTHIALIMTVLYVFGCQEDSPPVDKKRQPASEVAPTTPQNGGELFPHLQTPEFLFVGQFGDDFVYLQEGERRLAEGKLVAAVIVIRESDRAIARKPDTQLILPLASGADTAKLDEVALIPAPADSLMAMALKVLDTPESERDRIHKGHHKGRTARWSYVDRLPEGEAVYVSDSSKVVKGLSIIRMMAITEQRTLLFLDPTEKLFAAVDTDMTWTPSDSSSELVYMPIREGEVEDKVLQMIKDK